MTKFYLICLLFVAGGFANEQSESIGPQLDVVGTISNILNCLKYQLVFLDHNQIDDVTIDDNIEFSTIFWKHLMKFDQTISQKISVGPSGIVMKLNITLTWPKLVLGSNFIANLELLPPLFPAEVAIAGAVDDSGVVILANLTLVSNPPAGALPFKITDLKMNIIHGRTELEWFEYNHMDIYYSGRVFIINHPQFVADIQDNLIDKYLIQPILEALQTPTGIQPLMHAMKAKGARGIEECFNIAYN